MHQDKDGGKFNGGRTLHLTLSQKMVGHYGTNQKKWWDMCHKAPSIPPILLVTN